MRWLAFSAVIHAIGLWLFVANHSSRARVAPIATAAASKSATEPTELVVEVISVSSEPGGGGSSPGTSGAGASGSAPSSFSASASRASSSGRYAARRATPWAGVSITTDREGDSQRGGQGNGGGVGSGNGIGFGNGGGVEVARDVPAPPMPEVKPVSKARPAKLIWPNRDLDVEDESYLFIAKVTVDADGAVVGARMLTNRPGSRADHAANAIWSFRYAPALDDAGKPIASTFEQSFQVR